MRLQASVAPEECGTGFQPVETQVTNLCLGFGRFCLITNPG